MKWLTGFLVALALSVPTDLHAEAKTDASDKQAIAALWDGYELALAAGDIEAWLALWSRGGIQLPPGEPPVSGLDELKARNGRALAAFDVTMDIVLEESVVLGDHAYSRGSYMARFSPKAGGDPINVDGKFLSILKRQQDGSWRIFRDMFNSSTGPS